MFINTPTNNLFCRQGTAAALGSAVPAAYPQGAAAPLSSPAAGPAGSAAVGVPEEQTAAAPAPAPLPAAQAVAELVRRLLLLYGGHVTNTAFYKRTAIYCFAYDVHAKQPWSLQLRAVELAT